MEQGEENRDRRMTPDEAQAVIRLWSRRQWEREHWPTVADIAEGLGIEAGEAEALLREVQAGSSPTPNPGGAGRETWVGAGLPRPSSRSSTASGLGAAPLFRLAAAATGLTGFFCLYLERLLA